MAVASDRLPEEGKPVIQMVGRGAAVGMGNLSDTRDVGPV